MIDPKEIEKEIKLSIQAKVNALVNDGHLNSLITANLDQVINERIQAIISAHLNNLVQKGKLEKELDARYQEKISGLIQQEIKQKTANEVAKIDFPTSFGNVLYEIVDAKLKVAALPDKAINHKNINWDGFTLSASAIHGGVFQNFISAGIQDASRDIELTIADNLVIVENKLVTRNAEITDQLSASKITVGTIQVTDQLVLNENINKQFVSLIKDTLKIQTETKSVDVVSNPILANGKEALTENALGPSIINSNLRKLGRLTELNVVGIAEFNDTMLVTNTGKVGINTSSPDGALTIWDDDCEFTVKKFKKKNMFIGTMRDTDLSFGVNGDVKLALRKDGTVEMNHIELNGLKISVANSVPNHVGKPGELVLISNASENDPWAYRCLGGDRWKAIK